jgi:hypothetical protein
MASRRRQVILTSVYHGLGCHASLLISLAEFIIGCKQLRSIVLVNLKSVSDVGVRYLANGCHYLEALNGKLNEQPNTNALPKFCLI